MARSTPGPARDLPSPRNGPFHDRGPDPHPGFPGQIGPEGNPLEPSASNSSKLRLVACLVGTAGAFVVLRLAARISAAGAPATLPASWIDRLTLVLEPLIGIFALVAAVGLWRQQRWGAMAFTVLSILIASQLALVALLVAALAAFAWRPLLVWAGMLGLALVVGYRLVRSVWRWLG